MLPGLPALAEIGWSGRSNWRTQLPNLVHIRDQRPMPPTALKNELERGQDLNIDPLLADPAALRLGWLTLLEISLGFSLPGCDDWKDATPNKQARSDSESRTLHLSKTRPVKNAWEFSRSADLTK